MTSHDNKGSTDEALVNPWVRYVEKLGVKIRTNCGAKNIDVKDGEVSDVVIINEHNNEEKIIADVYVLAVPMEVMREIVAENTEIKAAAPSLANLDKLHTEASSGIQFFYTTDIKDKIPNGWWAFLDSPWSILGIYEDDEYYHFKRPVTGAVSLTWSNFDEPGVLYGKPAKDCTKEEIKNEILAQVSNGKTLSALRDIEMHSYYMDHAIEFSEETGEMIKHHAPLFIQFPGTRQYQPKSTTEIPNLFLAADYVQTSYDLATMESANEAGRKAVNGILDYTKHTAKRCYTKNEVRTGLGFFQFIDKYIYKIQSLFK